jgi:hypothetical protein
MEPKTITFLGKQRQVPRISGLALPRLGKALMEFSEAVSVEVDEPVKDDDGKITGTDRVVKPLGVALMGMPLKDYPELLRQAALVIIGAVRPIDFELSEAERLFYGAVGLMFATYDETTDRMTGALSAMAVASAHPDELTELLTSIYQSERSSQAGEYLTRIWAGSGREHTPNTPGASVSA